MVAWLGHVARGGREGACELVWTRVSPMGGVARDNLTLFKYLLAVGFGTTPIHHWVVPMILEGLAQQI